MSAKMGRPTNDPKTIHTMIRLSEKDLQMLEYCVSETGKTKAEIIREGIKAIYRRIKRNNGNA